MPYAPHAAMAYWAYREFLGAEFFFDRTVSPRCDPVLEWKIAYVEKLKTETCMKRLVETIHLPVNHAFPCSRFVAEVWMSEWFGHAPSKSASWFLSSRAHIQVNSLLCEWSVPTVFESDLPVHGVAPRPVEFTALCPQGDSHELLTKESFPASARPDVPVQGRIPKIADPIILNPRDAATVRNRTKHFNVRCAAEPQSRIRAKKGKVEVMDQETYYCIKEYDPEILLNPPADAVTPLTRRNLQKLNEYASEYNGTGACIKKNKIVSFKECHGSKKVTRVSFTTK